MRSAECGVWNGPRGGPARRPASGIGLPGSIPHSAFRIPHFTEVFQRNCPEILRDTYQPLEDPRRAQRVGPRAMPPHDLEPEVVRQRIQGAARERRQEPPRQPHGASPRPLQEERASPKQLRAEERPIKPDVVRHEHPTRERRQDHVGDPVEARRVSNQLIGDTREARDERRNGLLGIDERFVREPRLPVRDRGHRDLEDAMSATRARPRRFHIHHREAAGVERRARCRAGERPPAVAEPRHPRVPRQEPGGDPICQAPGRSRQREHVPHQHSARRGSGLQVGQRPIRETRRGQGGDAGQRSSRLKGRVMQRGPPPPRTSSLPSIVMTAR